MPWSVAGTVGPKGHGTVVRDAQLLINVAVVVVAIAVVVVAASGVVGMTRVSVLGIGTVAAEPFPARGREKRHVGVYVIYCTHIVIRILHQQQSKLLLD